MRVIEPSVNILTVSEHPLQLIERAGRTCYKSEDRITRESAGVFVRALIKRKHFSVLEHTSMTVKFVVDRGVSHELVRHRIASYSQESTRYCNYSSDKHGSELTFIRPCFWSPSGPRSEEYFDWKREMESAERAYLRFIARGATPEEARVLLPNSLKTEVVMTTNFRAWRAVFEARTDKAAHPQMRQVMSELFEESRVRWPDLFGDLV